MPLRAIHPPGRIFLDRKCSERRRAFAKAPGVGYCGNGIDPGPVYPRPKRNRLRRQSFSMIREAPGSIDIHPGSGDFVGLHFRRRHSMQQKGSARSQGGCISVVACPLWFAMPKLKSRRERYRSTRAADAAVPGKVPDPHGPLGREATSLKDSSPGEPETRYGPGWLESFSSDICAAFFKAAHVGTARQVCDFSSLACPSGRPPVGQSAAYSADALS
jgi:hypothetical protein